MMPHAVCSGTSSLRPAPVPVPVRTSGPAGVGRAASHQLPSRSSQLHCHNHDHCSCHHDLPIASPAAAGPGPGPGLIREAAGGKLGRRGRAAQGPGATAAAGQLHQATAAAAAAGPLVWAAASLLPAAASAAAELSSSGDAAADALAAQVAAALAAGTYVPSPLPTPGWEIWAGFIAGVIPFAIGSWEFAKRIIIQQRCKECNGKGLVPSNKEGVKYLRKCPQCGGFFPWVSWKLFLTSTAAPGNGGPLQFPKGQTGLFYDLSKTSSSASSSSGKQKADPEAALGGTAASDSTDTSARSSDKQ